MKKIIMPGNLSISQQAVEELDAQMGMEILPDSKLEIFKQLTGDEILKAIGPDLKILESRKIKSQQEAQTMAELLHYIIMGNNDYFVEIDVTQSGLFAGELTKVTGERMRKGVMPSTVIKDLIGVAGDYITAMMGSWPYHGEQIGHMQDFTIFAKCYPEIVKYGDNLAMKFFELLKTDEQFVQTMQEFIVSRELNGDSLEKAQQEWKRSLEQETQD